MGTVEILLNVTEKHINEGIRCSCRSCPVALAISDIIKPEYKSSVGATNFSIQEKTDSQCVEGSFRIHTDYLPLEAAHWIRKYDSIIMLHGQRVFCSEPITFPITLPREVVREDILERLDHEASNQV